MSSPHHPGADAKDEVVANTASYEPRQARGLSRTQRMLLLRAFSGPIVLQRDEVPSAQGLVRRGLARTYRPTRPSFSLERPSYVPGSRRTMSLTHAGVAVAKRLEAPPEKASPLTAYELWAMAEELAEAVLASSRRGSVKDLAQRLVDRLRESGLES